MRGLSSSAAALALGLVATLHGCGSAPPVRPKPVAPQLESMSELRALELIDGWLTEATWIGRPGWVVSISKDVQLEVDLRLGTSDYGVEWVSESDRESYGSALPPPAPEGQLRLLRTPDGAQILILDNEVYRSARESTLDRTLVLSDAEEKLRRDLLDFIAYINSQ